MFASAFLPTLRAGTTAFINTNPVTVVLTPHTSEDDGAGGTLHIAGTPRDAAVVTLVEAKNSGYLDKSVIPEGTNTVFDYMLIGQHDLVVGLYDTFSLDGQVYRVENIMMNNGYERRAKIVREADGGR